MLIAIIKVSSVVVAMLMMIDSLAVVLINSEFYVHSIIPIAIKTHSS